MKGKELFKQALTSGRSRAQARGARPPPPLIFCQTEARRAEKLFWGTASLVPLSKGLDDRGPPALSQVLDPALLTDHSQMY